jgi:hypothetical protein
MLEALAGRVVHGPDGLDELRDDRLEHRFMGENVVRRDAGLTGVRHTSPRDLPGRVADRGRGVNNRRVLAARLESDSREMLGGRFHDEASDALAPDVAPLSMTS